MSISTGVGKVKNIFFVKNLENVQGDERDVIFVSIGYGPDKDGNFFQSLGPVSSDGGERPLNVLFTRSRKRCVIFSSITHDQIRTDVSKYDGPRTLKQFLKYAETGEMDVPLVTGDEMDSPFESDVAQVLAQHGYRVETQVGSAGFKIDLAIYDPDKEGHFLLAIECDGARYHSSSWARERDRLRQEVPEKKGWTFHRIWSTDWFYSRDKEIAKMLNAIDVERARQSDFRTQVEVKSTPEYSFRESLPTDSERVDFKEKPLVDTKPYEEASFSISHRHIEIHEAPVQVLERYIAKIIGVEGPVHLDVVTVRLARLWGKSRVGNRIKSTVKKIVRQMVRRGSVLKSADQSNFYLLPDRQSGDEVRDRTDVELNTLKDPEMIPASEIRLAIQANVNACVSLSVEDCAKEVSYALGTKLKREQMKSKVKAVALSMASSGIISVQGDTLSRPRQ